MKIAIIGHANFPIAEPYAGGLEMITYNLVKKLQAAGHQVDLYAHPDSAADLPVKSFDDIHLPAFHIHFDQVDKTMFDQTVATYYSRVMMEVLSSDYDIVHNHSLHFLPIILGEHSKTPFITTFHTPVFPELDFALRTIKNPNQHFTTVSCSLARTYKHLINANVIYNGICLDQWSYNESPKGYVFWYGRICPEKGTHMAIEAATKIGSEILIAGPISNKEYYEKAVKPLIDNRKVRYIGHLKQTDINHVLRNAKAMLFSSTWDEPYGLTLAESLACGTPVISWDKGAAAEILDETCGVIIKPFDIDKYAAGILDAQSLDRKACRQRAEDFCGIETMVSRYEDFYKGVTLSKDLIVN
jgi:glycosyltransferase involved in cell wall biosynthesis